MQVIDFTTYREKVSKEMKFPVPFLQCDSFSCACQESYKAVMRYISSQLLCPYIGRKWEECSFVIGLFARTVSKSFFPDFLVAYYHLCTSTKIFSSLTLCHSFKYLTTLKYSWISKQENSPFVQSVVPTANFSTSSVGRLHLSIGEEGDHSKISSR